VFKKREGSNSRPDGCGEVYYSSSLSLPAEGDSYCEWAGKRTWKWMGILPQPTLWF